MTDLTHPSSFRVPHAGHTTPATAVVYEFHEYMHITRVSTCPSPPAPCPQGMLGVSAEAFHALPTGRRTRTVQVSSARLFASCRLRATAFLLFWELCQHP